MQKKILLMLLFTVALVAAGCGDDEENTNPDAMGDITGDTPSDGVDGVEEFVSGEIAEDTTWTSDTTYILTDLVFVTGGTLTIEAGTQVLGDGGSALVVTQNGQIDAVGTADNPIVFTSSKEAGTRRRGDRGGVVLLGNAPINVPAGQIEGIEASDNRGSYGGSDAADNCGTLKYARIEFAGFTIGADNELNGLTLGGCGTETDIDYIQVHMGDDDGIEFFGGTAGIKHAVVTRAADDSLDWDQGWQGRIQFLVIQQEGAEGDNGWEADNLEDNNDATPRSNPTIYNVTMAGSNDSAANQRAMTIRRGTAGQIFNVLMTGFPNESIDIRDEATVELINNDQLLFGNLIFHNIGSDGENYFSAEMGEDDDDGGFEESEYFEQPEVGAQFGVDPMLPDPYNVEAPGLVPPAESPAAMGAANPPSDDFFDVSATYIGAFEPGGEDWMAGWRAFPND